MSTNLYDVLKASYGDKDSVKNIENQGYKRDDELSNEKHQVYWNNDKKHLINSIRGTATLGDWGTNAYIALGKGEQTSRYKEEKSNLERAKEKYKDRAKTTVVGHSQSSYHASHAAGDNDEILTYNKAYFPGDKIQHNETHYRIVDDPVSIFAIGNRNTKNYLKVHDTNPWHFLNKVKNKLFFGNGIAESLDAHQLKHLRNKNIVIK
jgi:hypothetical protein